jgi:hypothetical protein
MKKNSLTIIIIYILGSCTSNLNENTTSADSKKNLTDTEDIASAPMKKDSIVSNNIPNFLELSKKATETTIGNLQGVKKNDSSGPYAIKEVISDSLSFDLILVPKYLKKNLVDFDTLKKGAENNYKDFFCYAFVYPMRKFNPANESYHLDNTTYPVFVKSYFIRKNIWVFISSKEINNLTELSTFKILTIYSNMN